MNAKVNFRGLSEMNGGPSLLRMVEKLINSVKNLKSIISCPAFAIVDYENDWSVSALFYYTMYFGAANFKIHCITAILHPISPLF